MRSNIKDLTGRNFGRLRVIERVENYRTNTQWLCECINCGKLSKVVGSKLSGGHTSSCICKNAELQSYENTYEIKGKIVTGTDHQGNIFLFDLEDFDRVKEYYWSVNPRGYVINVKNRLKLHRFILNAPKDKEVDHKFHITYDNRKSEIWICTHLENMQNRIDSKNKLECFN
jgi:hypothetical protein